MLPQLLYSSRYLANGADLALVLREKRRFTERAFTAVLAARKTEN